MTDIEPRRRASDFERPKRTLSGWLAENVTLALIIGAIVGIGGLLIGGTLWYSSVNGLGPRVDKVEPKVTLLENRVSAAEATLTRMQSDLVSADKRLNDMREKIDASDKSASDVRRTLDAADNKASEMLGRLDERLKANEAHSAPLPFNPPSRGASR
jgi:outer membrane murein-binding lipoprotein Lpp